MNDQSSGCCDVGAVVTGDARGQLVLPKDLRKQAGIEAGDKLAVITMKQGSHVCCLSLLPVEQLSGMVKQVLSPVISPDKPQVFSEAYRVLRKGGRMMVSDIVVEEPLPEQTQGNLELYARCVAGAMIEGEYLQSIRDAGFTKVEITSSRSAAGMISPDDPTVKAFIAEADIDPAEAQRIAAGIKSVEVLAYKYEHARERSRGFHEGDDITIWV